LELTKKRWMLVVVVLLVVIIISGIGGNFLIGTSFGAPVEDYARKHNLPSNIVDLLKPLDSDHQMNESDQAIVDGLVFARSYAEEKNMSDTTIEKIIVDSYSNTGVVVSDIKEQIQFLTTFSQIEQQQFIGNMSLTDFDWDGDHMSNYFEQCIANTPYDIYNGRYAIVVRTDENTTWAEELKNFFVNQQKFERNNVIKLEGNNATTENFGNAVSDIALRAGANDIVIISMQSHSNRQFFCFNDGNGTNNSVEYSISYGSMDKIIDAIKPGKMLITIAGCGLDAPVEPLTAGHSHRVVTDIDFHWIFNIHHEYDLSSYGRLGRAPLKFLDGSNNVLVRDSAGFMHHNAYIDEDLDGNGYVSVDEMLRTADKYQFEAASVTVSDKGNIASKFYLGDFNINDQC
jgi:hypothetical protein